MAARTLEIRGPADSAYGSHSGAITRIHQYRITSFAVNNPVGDVQRLKIHRRDVR